MDAQQFLAEFGHIANAPGGVAKLRELILGMAMYGQLLTQEYDDEPAAQFLVRIQAEKIRHVFEKKLKRTAPERLISKQDKLPIIPNNWEWVRLGTISTKLTDGSHNPPKGALDGYAMISGQNVLDGTIDFTNPSRFLAEDDFQKEHARTKVKPGDVLLTIVGSLGRSSVVPKNAPAFAMQRSVAVISSPLQPEFLSLQFRSPFARSYYELHGKGTAQKGIYLAKLGDMPISVPPIAEQARIVAKVDELMALCDRLEQQQQQRRKLQNALRQSILQAVATATSPQELQNTWNRLANHFGQIFSAPEDILLIKSTILNLAMRGLLVEQFIEDTRADSLLADIARERQQLAATQKQKSASAIPALKEDELPYQLPKGWVWARVVDLVDVGTGATPAKSEPSFYGGDIPWYTSSATNNKFARVPETFITEKAINKTNCKVFPEGSLIVALYGQGKTRGQISELTIAGATNQALAAMVFYKSSIKVKRYLKIL